MELAINELMKQYSQNQEMSPAEIEVIAEVLDAAKASVDVYLKEAKRAADRDKSFAMEAVAIKRAVIADTLLNIASVESENQRSDRDVAALESEEGIQRVDSRLFKVADRMSRKFETKQNLKNLATSLRMSVGGFGLGPLCNK